MANEPAGNTAVPFRSLRSVRRFLTGHPLVVTTQSIIGMIIVWHVVGVVLGYGDVTSSPGAVAAFFTELMISLEWVPHTLSSFRRVVIAFIIGWAVGIFTALFLGFTNFWEAVIRDYVLAGLSLPTALLVVFAAMWFGRSDITPIVAAVLVIIPYPAEMTYEAVKDVDEDLVQMAKSFGLSRRRIAVRIVLRSVLPQVFAAARISFMAAWSVVVFAEVIASGSGVGFMIQQQMMNFSMAGLISWTFIITSFVIIWEYAVLQRLEGQLFEYRSQIGSLANQMGPME